jgi:hypothetical protein
VYEAISIEELNKPVVVLCNEHFMNDAHSAASSKHMASLRCVAVSVPPECSIMDQVEAGLKQPVMENLITALTKPLTPEESSPQIKESEKPASVVFKGNLEEVNLFFYKRGWTDGLPIIPPTEKAVTEMLTGTDLPHDHVVGKIEPRLGKATVEKIAINAVMAGALPVYMPILIAGVQAFMKPSKFAGLSVSTGSWSPFWVINGPIRHDLQINSGQGALSPGNIANAAIGRAMALIIKNLGGIRKGIEDMGTIGNAGKYSMVLAENEEESPWEPLHTEHGFKREDNAITLSFPNCFWQVVPYGTNDKGILRSLSYNLLPMWGGTLTVILIPTLAKILANSGWTKRTITDFIANYARAPLHRLPQFHGALLGLPGRKDKQLTMDSEDSVPIIENSDMIRVIVAGGAGAFMGLAQGAESWVTRKIELPANWDNLIKKYKDIIPAHIRY